MTTSLSRRAVLRAGLGAAAAGVLVACGGDDDPEPAASPSTSTSRTGESASETTTLTPTPGCDDGDEATPAQTEGPYFTSGSPERTDITDGASGTKLTLTGTVVTTDCRPVERAKVDFWQADDGGDYDNSAYHFRGHQFTDAEGRYTLSTVVPGLYPGRTRHIHVKAQAPNGPVLTTQLYFPGEGQNAGDGIFDDALLIDIRDVSSGKAGTYMFVIEA